MTTDEAGDQGRSHSGAATPSLKPDSPEGFSEEKPVKVGQELDVEITEMSRRGDGIARIQGFVVFVPRATNGQKVKIKVASVRPNFAVAEIIEQSV
ncbi:MAG: TRAM domain-containing protein [Thaumarchaeota archaeon]|nr:TRAM domain-containing protein [Nitrososphaerota archaeon]